jgi:phosphatidylserine/phosphatidylglycerophosphate/cardiolipin synthase-like enzyme
MPRGRDDVHAATRVALLEAGVLTRAGVHVTSRAAELVAVCEILAASSLPDPAPPADPRLVLSAPPGSAPIADYEKLELLVLDVIRQAEHTLHLGGAFWNDAGFDSLDTVLRPALETRDVKTTLYVHPPKREYMPALQSRIAALSTSGNLGVRWFTGPMPTMLHAKFVIRDRLHGYLGTANLTSWGMGAHVEAGVETTAGQSERFIHFLEDLDAAGYFVSSAPT